MPSATATQAHSPARTARTIEPTLPSLKPLEAGSRGVPPPPDRPVSAAPAPVRLTIPSIGVDTPLLRLDMDRDGTIQVPSDFNTPGWYGRGPAPGAEGAAVILGHLDSNTGPAVFWRLSSLSPGDPVRIRRADGSEVRFTIQRTQSYSVDSFPSFEVYGATSRPELRLITCAGTYSRSRGQYLSNVVAFAALSA
jgi:sortase (surface protein transpeptidase)